MSRLSKALNLVVDEYEILRTVFPRRSHMKWPVQVVRPHMHVNLQLVELQGLVAPRRREVLTTGAAKLGQRQFDSNGPLLRASLLKTGELEHVLVISASALTSDHIGLQKLIDAMAHSYGGTRSDCAGSLQYVDVSTWLTEFLEDADDELEHWKRIDPEAQKPVRLANPRPQSGPLLFRSVVSTVQGRNSSLLSGVLRYDLPSFFLTCWQMLLSRLLEGSELVVGVGCDGRTEAELEDVIGPMAHRPYKAPTRAKIRRSGSMF